MGGRTAHSTFKLPLGLVNNESPTCSVSKTSKEAELIRQAGIILIDECSMLHKRAFEAIDRLLQDLHGKPKLFGGVTVVIAGDFRQCLPVVAGGTSADQVNACLKSSSLWNHVQVYSDLHILFGSSNHSTVIKVMKLRTNMRAKLTGDIESARFAAQLLKVGNGNIAHVSEKSEIMIPTGFGTSVSSLDELKACVYPNLAANVSKVEWVRDRAILSARNTTVNSINSSLLGQMTGQNRVYKSIDTVCDQDSVLEYPMEFLNKLDISGLPPHELNLKVGCPVMLLRNLGNIFVSANESFLSSSNRIAV